MKALVTPPAEDVLTLAEAKAHLRVDSSHEDTLISSLLASATERFDAEHGVLGRALVTQTWQMTGPAFGSEWKISPVPVQSIASVTYLDADEVPQMLASTNYRLVKDNQTATIHWRNDLPGVADHHEAITVQFVAGYGAASAVPVGIKQAILLLVGHWHEHRQIVAFGSHSPIAMALDAQTQLYRVGGALT